METTHRLQVGDARDLGFLPDASVQLVVTSPPYPMIAMWDQVFEAMDPAVGSLLAEERGLEAFEAMHRCLDAVWAECFRVLAPGGFACVNIGDATRSLGGEFQLYPNHARIVSAALALGFTVLPDILWRKPTNAPNKFMGSGMLPAGAYVTYEHEYVLIFRKGGKRVFRSKEDRAWRQRSAFFWEERNQWFSDVWMDLRGTRQQVGSVADRDRSAAFPLELPRRLVYMYSAQGDTVLDPFAGTGTTAAAAAVAGRSSVGVELDGSFAPLVGQSLTGAVRYGPGLVQRRLDAHRDFVVERLAAGKVMKHFNEPHGLPVVTGQERRLELLVPTSMSDDGPCRWTVEHQPAGLAEPVPGHEPPCPPEAAPAVNPPEPPAEPVLAEPEVAPPAPVSDAPDDAASAPDPEGQQLLF